MAGRRRTGEGPLWDEDSGRLYFVDITSHQLHAFTAATGERQSWRLPDYICWLLPRRDGDGFMAGLRCKVVRLWLEPALRIEPLGLPLELASDVRLNDAKVHPNGHLWFGSMNGVDKQRPDGRLFRLTPDGTLTVEETGVRICNGPAFSNDGRTMYHTDTMIGQVSAYSLETHRAAGKRLWRQFENAAEGGPDGMTVDAEGGIWIAQWGGARVCRYLPDGSLAAVVHLPVSQPSSCVFGGPDLRTLYITSARESLGASRLAREPLAGGLFAVDVPVQGVPAARFGA
jgi:D-xylonolactonase